MRPIRVLTIGHSYTIALNRAIVRELAKTRDFEITVVAPKFLLGDLRSVSIEPEPPASNLRIVALDATFSQFPQLLGYDAVQLTRVVARASHRHRPHMGGAVDVFGASDRSRVGTDACVGVVLDVRKHPSGVSAAAL